MARFGKNTEEGFELESGNAGAFFGTLATELGDGLQLYGPFAEYAARFAQLRDSYFAGRIDAIAFGAVLTDMRVHTDNGALWSIGATTGRWYRRIASDGQQWVACAPPVSAEDQNGRLVNRDGDNVGWDVSELKATDVAKLSAYTGDDIRVLGAAPTSTNIPAKVAVGDLFGAYIDEVDTEVSSDGILVVDDLDGDDSWKLRYLASTPKALVALEAAQPKPEPEVKPTHLPVIPEWPLN